MSRDVADGGSAGGRPRHILSHDAHARARAHRGVLIRVGLRLDTVEHLVDRVAACRHAGLRALVGDDLILGRGDALRTSGLDAGHQLVRLHTAVAHVRLVALVAEDLREPGADAAEQPRRRGVGLLRRLLLRLQVLLAEAEVPRHAELILSSLQPGVLTGDADVLPARVVERAGELALRGLLVLQRGLLGLARTGEPDAGCVVRSAAVCKRGIGAAAGHARLGLLGGERVLDLALSGELAGALLLARGDPLQLVDLLQLLLAHLIGLRRVELRRLLSGESERLLRVRVLRWQRLVDAEVLKQVGGPHGYWLLAAPGRNAGPSTPQVNSSSDSSKAAPKTSVTVAWTSAPPAKYCAPVGAPAEKVCDWFGSGVRTENGRNCGCPCAAAIAASSCADVFGEEPPLGV